MILVLAGTQDGRELAARLVAAGYEVLASAATEYGGELLRIAPGVKVRDGKLDEDSLTQLILSQGVQGLLDATHPFATGISTLARDVADRCGVPYLRWERQQSDLPDNHLVHRAADMESAAICLASLGVQRVFLAVGVKPLSVFVKHPLLQHCCFMVRVLPVTSSLEACQNLGISPAQIVAFQGFGTVRLNQALLESYQAQVLVIKDAGREGGTAEKAEAALNLGLHLVVVERPPEQTPDSVSNWPEVLDWAVSLG